MRVPLLDFRFQARAKPDRLADRFAEHLRHARRDRARRESTRLEHHDLAVRERAFAEQRERHAGRFAGARRRLQDHVRMRRDGRLQLGQRGVDRQDGIEGFFTALW